MQDPRAHKGSFRIGHLFCIVNAMKDLRARASEIQHPIYVQMGGEDKVADNEAALAWIRRTNSQDKRYEVYPICQHVIYKKAKNQHDDLAGRISVIADNVEWMVERAPATGCGAGSPTRRRQVRLASYASDESSMSGSTSRTSLFEEEEDADDTASVATTVPTTPSINETEAFIQAKEAEGFQGREQGHLLPEHLRGWRTDEMGEKRLYRPTWNFREDTRPFLYDPNSA